MPRSETADKSLLQQSSTHINTKTFLPGTSIYTSASKKNYMNNKHIKLQFIQFANGDIQKTTKIFTK